MQLFVPNKIFSYFYKNQINLFPLLFGSVHSSANISLNIALNFSNTIDDTEKFRSSCSILSLTKFSHFPISTHFRTFWKKWSKLKIKSRKITFINWQHKAVVDVSKILIGFKKMTVRNKKKIRHNIRLYWTLFIRPCSNKRKENPIIRPYNFKLFRCCLP